MHSTDRIDGSPQDEACANIDSHGTADNSSSSRAIRAATGERRAGVVPLYLIPQAVADEIRRHGRAVREIHIHRTRNHHYTVSVERGRP